MIKKIVFYFVLTLSIAALYKLYPLLGDYGQLASYGKGYFWGNLLVLGLGLITMIFTYPFVNSSDEKKTQ